LTESRRQNPNNVWHCGS